MAIMQQIARCFGQVVVQELANLMEVMTQL